MRASRFSLSLSSALHRRPASCPHPSVPRRFASGKPLATHVPPIKVKDRHYSRAELEDFLHNRLQQAPALPRRPLPILAIGTGNITQVAHWPSYKEAGFTVQGVTDANPAAAKAAAEAFGVRRVYESVQAMVADNRGAEVVYDIAVPAKAILGILQQLPEGSHALIQKPMGENLQEARAIRDLCRSKKIHGAVNFQLRTAAYIIALKHLLSEGVIGEVTGIEFRVNVETPWWKWPFLEQASRMEIIYHSIHYIDCLRDLYGEPQRLHAMTYKHVSTPRLHSVRSDLLFLYSPWVQATIHTNHFHRWGTQHAESALQVEGTKGAVVIRMGGNIAYPRSDLDFLHVATDATSGDWLDVKLQGSWFPHAFKGTMANVMRKARGEIAEVPTSVDDAYRTMAVCEAAYASAEQLTPIKYD